MRRDYRADLTLSVHRPWAEIFTRQRCCALQLSSRLVDPFFPRNSYTQGRIHRWNQVRTRRAEPIQVSAASRSRPKTKSRSRGGSLGGARNGLRLWVQPRFVRGSVQDQNQARVQVLFFDQKAPRLGQGSESRAGPRRTQASLNGGCRAHHSTDKNASHREFTEVRGNRTKNGKDVIVGSGEQLRDTFASPHGSVPHSS